jgi:hypothetical protein
MSPTKVYMISPTLHEHFNMFNKSHQANLHVFIECLYGHHQVTCEKIHSCLHEKNSTSLYDYKYICAMPSYTNASTIMYLENVFKCIILWNCHTNSKSGGQMMMHEIIQKQKIMLCFFLYFSVCVHVH